MKVQGLFLFSIFAGWAFCLHAGEEKMVREPAVAGQFYPADKNELSAMLDGFFSNTKKQGIKGEIIGLVSPHAGYVFSAQTAAWAYKQIEGKDIDTVILVGSSHNFPVEGAAVWTGGDFSTPLGNVAIDDELVKKLLDSEPAVRPDDTPHKPEHSIEVQIPFLQKMLKNFRIVPLLINDEKYSEKIAAAIAKAAAGKKILLVASTDMTHYPSKKDAETIDKDMLKSIGTFDTAEVINHNETWLSKGVPNLYCTLCGLPAVLTVMSASKLLGADSAQTINYSNSSDSKYGDASRVVGYGGVALIKSSKPGRGKADKTGKSESNKTQEKDFSLTKNAQDELLKIARSSIEFYIVNGKMPSVSTKNPELLADGAVFVTLEKNHDLRGCIGTTESRMPLYKAVSTLAIAAAVEDTRFNPVTADELKDITIEISVLSAQKKINSPNEIIPHKHGVVVRKGLRCGLFLPQVWEHPQLAGKDAFLSELCCQKAGLEPDAWKKEGTDLYTFTVFAFKEKE